MTSERVYSLRETVARAASFAERGRIMKGYHELLEGLRVARAGPVERAELEAVLWYAAIEMYEIRWFPEEWLPLVKQRGGVADVEQVMRRGLA